MSGSSLSERVRVLLVRRRPAGLLELGSGHRVGRRPDAYVNRQYQYARRPAPVGALEAKVGSACTDIKGSLVADHATAGAGPPPRVRIACWRSSARKPPT